MSTQLPEEVQQRLRELEKEFNDGDITPQGFEKKKTKLLAPYVTPQENGTEASRPYNYTQEHAESAARVVAVQAALAGREGRDKDAPMASRRPVANTKENHAPPPPSYTSSVSSSSSTPPPSNAPVPSQVLSPSTSNTSIDSEERGGRVQSSTPARQPSGKGSPPPTAPKKTPKAPVQQPPHIGRAEPIAADRETVIGDSPGKNGAVSHKIQQLLNTLKRPKKHRGPVEELYQEDMGTQVPEDANAPKPTRPMMQPVVGSPPENRQDWHRNLEAALQHYSGQQGGKQPAISLVDAHGKVSVAATYKKLYARAMKVAYYMLNKLGGGKIVSPGTTVALVFRNDEANAFVTAFYSCILAGVIPVALEPPLTREDPGGQQVGFLLGSLNISVALTSELTAKNLPKEEGKEHIVHFKGWPRLTWFLTEHLPKPPKDWAVPQRPTPDSPAYIEYSSAKDGSALGVVVSRSALLMHCRSLSSACMYREGEVLVCTEDPKKSIGLWHAVMTAVYCGLHVVYIPPSVTATLPLCWLQVVHRQSASCVLSSSHRLGMCVQLGNHRDLKDVTLQTVRILLLDDGANPWSLASSDLFYEAFSSRGLVREALCPCAGSPETLTVSLRRPNASTTTGRGVMSISGLSYGVVRTEEADSITSLTLQDVGLVMPGARIVVVKPSGSPVLCRADEVGEICVQSLATGSMYWGLQGKSTNTFKVQPMDERNLPIFSGLYVRSGLLGFVTEGGLVFVCGTLDGLIQIAGRRHNTEDLIATVLAVEPHSFVHKNALAVFSVSVLKLERVVVVAEQKPNCTDEQAFTWMNSVVPAIESIHGINLYGLILVKAGHLPRDSSGRVLVHETKQRFLDGQLHPENILMCPYQCITNLPTAKVHSSAMNNAKIIGDLVMGRVGSVSSGSLLKQTEEDPAAKMDFIADILRWNALENPDTKLFTLIDAKGHAAKTLTAQQLHKRAERLASFIQDKLKLNSGDHVALIYPAGLDLVCAFYACLYIGIVPVLIQPPNTISASSNLPTIKIILEVSNSRAILTLHTITRFLKSKEAASIIDPKALPPMLETDDVSNKKLEKFYKAPTTELIAYLDFSVSTTGILSGVKISHQAVISMCRAHKAVADLHPSRELAVCLDPYSGLGLVLWILSGVYSGHHTYLVCLPEVELNPLLWLSVVSENKVQDIYCSYSAVDLCCKELGNDAESLKTKGISLSCLQTCVVVSEERPRQALLTSFSTLLSPLGLPSSSVTASFSCRVNPLVALQGPHQPEASVVYVDQRALRVDRVSLLERGAPYSIGIMECAKVAPGVQVAIVNPETKMACAVTDLGEIWVSSLHNGSGYYGLRDEDNDTLSREHFRTVMAGGGDTTAVFSRTGYLGFVKKSDKPDKNGVVHDSLIVVGALDEALIIRGARYHPSDIEASVVRCSRSIVSSAVFTSNNLLVVVAELKGEENEALDVVPLITTALVEEQQLIAGIVVVADPGTIPINARGEKQRVHIKDLFLADQIDPIYVAYNL